MSDSPKASVHSARIRHPHGHWFSGSVLAIGGLTLSFILLGGGCCVDVWYGYRVHGVVVDADTLEPLTSADLGGRILKDGEELSLFSGSPGLVNVPAPDENGGFVLRFVERHAGACNIGGIIYERPELTRPDQVEVIVVHDGCEQSFIIELNEDTVVDWAFPDDDIELKDPILVPACEG